MQSRVRSGRTFALYDHAARGAWLYVSLKDVAAQAGVSFQTASKVLNGCAGTVSEPTRQRIRSAALELGYVPNALARGLVRRSSYTIGVLADDFSDPALSRFVAAAQQEAQRQGHAALISVVQPFTDPRAALRTLLEHRVNGVLIIAPSLENDPRLGEALARDLPAVSLNHVPGGGVPVVGSDHRATGGLAARHLLSLGHRHLATITGPRSRRVTRSRLQGFRLALQEADVPLPPERVVEADWTAPGGHAALHRLLDGTRDVTGLFVQSDVMALGAMRALAERGLRVPDDCSVVGCDDLPVAEYVTPPLTTVRLPFEETGVRAAARLLGLIRMEAGAHRQLLPVELVVRCSTGPPTKAVMRRGAARRSRPAAATMIGGGR